MKRATLIVLLLGAAVVAASVYVIVNRPPAADLSLDAQVAQILDDGGCISCHSSEPVLPFYAKFPVADKILKQDIDSGYRAFDITPMLEAMAAGEAPNVVDVAKVERVAVEKSMPMAKYYLVHWGSQMTDAKRDVLVAWARKFRADYYNDGLVGELAGEPVRPIAESIAVDERKAKLGRELYHDVRLSADNTVSCASCHGLQTAGVDNKQYSEGVDGQLGGVNAPTVYNAVYNFVQFWDGRAATLAEQAAGPPLNPVEMASKSFDEIIAKLEKDKLYVEAFKQLYPDGITEANITDAIEQFERTLITPDSRFDKYLKGDKGAISAEELAGYELFKEARCATCHVGPNLGGQTYELMGLRAHYFADRGLPLTEEDNGRFKQTQQERDKHRFKVPGLRNVALTWPYYHDGTRTTLEQAVRDMARYQSGVELSDEQVAQIVAFLETLTGQYGGKVLTNSNSQK